MNSYRMLIIFENKCYTVRTTANSMEEAIQKVVKEKNIPGKCIESISKEDIEVI